MMQVHEGPMLFKGRAERNMGLAWFGGHGEKCHSSDCNVEGIGRVSYMVTL